MKNVPKWDKKLSVAPYSHEPYIWSSFMVHMCKRIISAGVFYIFPNYNFWGQQWGIRTKNGPKWQKIVCCTPFLRISIRHMIVSFVHKYKMMRSPNDFFIFSKFWFSGFFGGRGQDKRAKNVWNNSLKQYLITRRSKMPPKK